MSYSCRFTIDKSQYLLYNVCILKLRGGAQAPLNDEYGEEHEMRNLMIVLVVLASIPAFCADESVDIVEQARRQRFARAGYQIAAAALTGSATCSGVQIVPVKRAVDQLAESWVGHYMEARESRSKVAAMLDADLAEVGKANSLTEAEMAAFAKIAKDLFAAQSEKNWSGALLRDVLPSLGEALINCAEQMKKANPDDAKETAMSKAVREALGRAYTARMVADNTPPPESK